MQHLLHILSLNVYYLQLLDLVCQNFQSLYADVGLLIVKKLQQLCYVKSFETRMANDCRLLLNIILEKEHSIHPNLVIVVMADALYELEHCRLLVEACLPDLLRETNEKAVSFLTFGKRILERWHLHEKREDCLKCVCQVSPRHYRIEDRVPGVY